MRYFITALLLCATLFGASTFKSPVKSYKASGNVTDLIYKSDSKELYAATDNGYVDVFVMDKSKPVHSLHLSKIKDFMGDPIDSKIFSIDMIKGKMLILSQDNGGFNRVHIYQNKKLTQIISSEDRFNIAKAKFIDENTILMALLSNDIISYDIAKKKENWSVQASMSKFSDFALDEKRERAAIVDESGALHIISTKDGKTLHEISGINVDNVFSVDFKNDVVLTGAQDRRAGVYNLRTSQNYYMHAKFFVYGVGLSPSARFGAFSYDVQNNVELFDTQNREVLAHYKTTGDIINGIRFIDESTFFIYSNNNTIGLYRR